MIYEALNLPVLERVPKTSRHVLDVGCGTGTLGRALKERQPCRVTGITRSTAEAEQASRNLDQVLVQDIECLSLPADYNRFDCIICSHILEHLLQPEKTLISLRRFLLPQGVLIIALPNVLFWKQRLEFLRGRFRYADSGLMDRTHLRFFDQQTARALLADSGYAGIEWGADGYFPLPGIRAVFPKAASWVDHWAISRRPGLFGFQFILVAQKEEPTA